MMTPVDLRDVGAKELLIVWEDGSRTLYDYRQLRYHCPCAQCVNEMTGQRMVTLAQISPEVKVLESHPVGNYAVRFQWSDGHSTGIYAYQYLLSLYPANSAPKSF